MPNVNATQEDPTNPGADDWRPEPPRDPDREKAEFLASWGKPDKPEKVAKGKAAPPPADDDDDLDDADDSDDEEDVDLVEAAPAKKAKRAPVEEDEDDEEVETDQDEEEEEDDDDEEKAEDEDPDADLDEDDEKPEKDPKVAAGLAKLQRQEKRMREQIDRERESVRSELAQGRQRLESLQSEIEKAKSKYEGLAERAKLDPLGVLEELGVDDDDFVGKQAYARLKAKTDPAFREAAAKMKSERTIRAELDALKAKDAAREKEAEEAKRTAAMKAQVDSMLGAIAKEARGVDKATLTQRLMRSDPETAQGLFAHAHVTLMKRDGVEPSPRKVVLEAERIQRAQLRKYGIDPRTLGAAPEAEKSSAGVSETRTSGKPAKGKVKRSVDDELRRPTKEELLQEDWTSGIRTR